MHQLPGAPQPVATSVLCRVAECHRLLEQEQLLAVREGGGVGWHAVVSAAPGGEVELTGLALDPAREEVLHERTDRVPGQPFAEELRLAERDSLLRLPVHVLRSRA